MRIICTCFLLFALGFLFPLQAQTIFMKITGPDGPIAGESLNMSFRDHVDALSFGQASTAACAATSGGSRDACQANTGNFFLQVKFDKSLNLLRRHMYRGTALPRVELFFVKNTGIDKPQTYYSIRMDNVFLVSISDAKGNDNESNAIQLELDPQKIGWTHYPQGPDGKLLTPVKFGWDRGANTEWSF